MFAINRTVCCLGACGVSFHVAPGSTHVSMQSALIHLLYGEPALLHVAVLHQAHKMTPSEWCLSSLTDGPPRCQVQGSQAHKNACYNI